MDDDNIQKAVRRAADIIAGSSRLVAFTGAGVSADSGIPTFRGPGGIWGSYDERHLELGFFMSRPETAWNTIRKIFYDYTLSVEPNDAHRILASWERSGRLGLVVTQNIDGLHGRAGSKAVAEFHGSCSELVCLACGGRVQATRELVAPSPPRCPCGGLYKPGFTFFGEGIPPEAYAASVDAAEEADACLIIGSTGTVYPAASIPRIVKRRGGLVVEVNPVPSEFTEAVSDAFVPLGAAEAMRRIDAALATRATERP
ncbi:MAG: RNA polymerase subunit sigma [Spirochaetes bacterium]|nr:RNA polymerase subunit sigma [Spirochaetota bacterium]MBU1079718.1 RNA polymerase subunit sigma [Spirochaetota bacterium]